MINNTLPSSSSCLRSGVWPFLLVISLCHLILRFLDWFVPRKYIDRCPLDNPFWEGTVASRSRQSLNDVRVHVHPIPGGESFGKSTSSLNRHKKRHKQQSSSPSWRPIFGTNGMMPEEGYWIYLLLEGNCDNAFTNRAQSRWEIKQTYSLFCVVV